jgi:hypothetical protein
MGLHYVLYRETGIRAFGLYPCGGLFAACRLGLLIKSNRDEKEYLMASIDFVRCSWNSD